MTPRYYENCVEALAGLPARDLVDFALQRTTALIQMGGGKALQAWFATGSKHELEALLADPELKRVFVARAVAEVFTEANALMPTLQKFKIATAASIGPGVGIFEFLYRAVSNARLILIDIESSFEHAHGYAQRGSGYASLALTREFYAKGGVPAEMSCSAIRARRPCRWTRSTRCSASFQWGFTTRAMNTSTISARTCGPAGCWFSTNARRAGRGLGPTRAAVRHR